MSESVSAFISKNSIRKFVCGAKARAERAAVKTVAGLMLASAFTACSPSESKSETDDGKPTTAYAITENGDTLCSYLVVTKDKASLGRLQGLVNNATKSKTGCLVLKAISEQGTVLTVDTAKSNTVGFFNPDNNSITLNKKFGDEILQSCLIHEGKHSVQNNALKLLPNYMYDFASNTIVSRAKEADAVATQTKFSYEMMQQGDSTAWKELKGSHPAITRAFETQALRHGIDSKQAMNAAMLKWYDDIPYSSLYDASRLDYHSRMSHSNSGENLKTMFLRTVNADSVITRICALDGVSYAGTDGSVLKSPRTFSITSDMYTQAKRLCAYQASKCGRSDSSVSGMYVVSKNNERLDITYGQAAANLNAKMKANAVSYQFAARRYTGR